MSPKDMFSNVMEAGVSEMTVKAVVIALSRTLSEVGIVMRLAAFLA